MTNVLMYKFRIFIAPATAPTLLFVLTSKKLLRIEMPKERTRKIISTAKVTHNQMLKAPVSLEIDFSNKTACVLDDFEIFCYNSSNLHQKWKLPSPDIFPASECEFRFNNLTKPSMLCVY